MKQKKWLTLLAAGIMASSFVFGSLGVFAAESAVKEETVTEEQTQTEETAQEEAEAPISEQPISETEYAKKYIEEYFGIQNLPEVLSVTDFYKALGKLPLDLDATFREEGELRYPRAVKMAVEAAGMGELALTYPVEKADAVLEANEMRSLKKSEYAKYIACALDIGLIGSDEERGAIVLNRAMTDDLAAVLLMNIARVTGNGENYLGYTNDADIYGKLKNAYDSFVIFSDEKLDYVGSKAVENQITTGYNIKKDCYNANFLPELTLVYGHSDIQHALQLIGLLDSEGIVAKVQLEPKISIYEHLLEWGPVPEPTDTSRVEKFSDDLYLTYAIEYDMALEFETQEDKYAFDSIIMDYAKKNDYDPEDKKLIIESWWQPLYTSTVEMGDNYYLIYDNVVRNGEYTIHPFCLPSDKDTVKEQLKALDPTIEVEQKPLYCDAPFYRYLNGDYQ